MPKLRSFLIRLLFRENQDCPWCDAGFPAYRRQGAFSSRWIHFTPHNGKVECPNVSIREQALKEEPKRLSPDQYLDALKTQKRIIDWEISSREKTRANA